MYETRMDLYDQTRKATMTKEEAHSSKFLSKVYGYMFIALAITTVVAALFSLFFNMALTSGAEEETLTMALFAILIVSFIGLLVCSITISIMAIRRKHSIAVPGILYSIFMGVFLGMIVYPFLQDGEWWIVASAIGITAVVFGGMYLIGKYTKRNLNWLGMLGMGMLFGALMISALAFVMFLLMPAMTTWIYVIIDAVIFAAFLFIATWDVWRIQKIAENGENSNNLAMFCAFNLYSDVIYIFLRILLIISKLAGKRR